jgi:hypothetical protein
MPVPLGRSGSEPQETAGKHTLERPSLAPMDPRESALGLENMHIGQRGPKNPTVGARSDRLNGADVLRS